MSLKCRLKKLETMLPDSGVPVLPFWCDDDDVGGFEWKGERLTWEAYERRWPEAPRVLRWYRPAGTQADSKA